MPLLNIKEKVMTFKVVYYGAGLCGKTTNLSYIHRQVSPSHRGELISLATETERTLYFDFLPLDLGTTNDFKIKLSLYTVPGQSQLIRSRQLILRGVDAIVFVADSAPERAEANRESFDDMLANLESHKLKLENIPWVLQFNKRDLINAMPLKKLYESLNKDHDVPAFESIATEGKGVFSTLREVSKLAIKRI
jgi:signal recognition particle receptor subunit beta